MAFTLVSPARRTLVAVIATVVVALSVYETRMLDSGYGAWLNMLGESDDKPDEATQIAAADPTPAPPVAKETESEAEVVRDKSA